MTVKKDVRGEEESEVEWPFSDRVHIVSGIVSRDDANTVVLKY